MESLDDAERQRIIFTDEGPGRYGQGKDLMCLPAGILSGGIRVADVFVRHPVAIVIHTAQKTVQPLGGYMIRAPFTDECDFFIAAFQHMLRGKLPCQAVVCVDPAHTASGAGMADMDMGKPAFRKQPGELREGTGTMDENTVCQPFPDKPGEIFLRFGRIREVRQHQRISMLRQSSSDAAENVKHMWVAVGLLFFQAG